MRTHRRLGAALLFGAFLLAGCEDTTGPEIQDDTFDADAALADYAAFEGILSADEFASFRALAGRTPFSGPASGMAVVSGLLEADAPVNSRAFALDLMRRVRAAEAAPPVAAAPIISIWTRGATYTYSPELDRYQLAAGREGAPATGVRFVLYEVDEAGRPIAGEETGYADLIDEGDDSLEDIALRFVVVEGETTRLDYRTTLTVGEGTGALTVEGFLQGPQNRLDFDIEVTGSDQGGQERVDLAFELGVEARDFEIVGTVSGVEADGEGDGRVDVTVRHGQDSIQLDVQVAAGNLNGTIRLNGQVFATASGPEDDPTFVDPDGDPLTTSEFLVIRSILDGVEDVFDLLEDLVDPVDELVILGIIL
jgi:hypothetical protein